MLVRQQTTTELTPDAIHALGLAEVKRIQLQVMLAAGKADTRGSCATCARGCARIRPTFPFREPDEVLGTCAPSMRASSRHCPSSSPALPRAPLEIAAPIRHRGLDAGAVAAAVGRRDAARGLRVPIVDAREISTVSLTSLLAHEGCRATTSKGARARAALPALSGRDLWINAYGRAGRSTPRASGHEMGLYRGDRARSSAATLDELYRAARLVATRGCTRKAGRARGRSIHAARRRLSQARRDQRGLRYMAWPAQALG
jgi:uncharacterized protein (DUF885 family)